jgi:hypothetical protein
MLAAFRLALDAEPDVAYALLFGSSARGTAHAGSDADVAHQYGILDWQRVHALATSDLGDLDALCAILADRTREQS